MSRADHAKWGAYCIECRETVLPDENNECPECGEETVPMVSWADIRDLDSENSKLKNTVSILENTLVFARDRLRCEVSNHPCNTDTRVIGAPPCCASCRVHLDIQKILRGYHEQTKS